MKTISFAITSIVFALTFSVVERAVRRHRSERITPRSEAEYRQILDHAPVLIWAARPDTTLHYLNRTSTEFTGLSMNALLDNGWLTAVHPDDVEACMAVYLPAVQQGRAFEMEYRLRRADGVYRWIRDMGVPQFGENGELAGYVGATSDVSERKRGEDAIRESRLALAGKHREIRQLAGKLITAHEDERRRLARELHDDLTQRLARLAIDAGQMANSISSPELLSQLREQLVRLSEDVHALSYRLHPSVLDDLGLVQALRAECERVERHNRVRVNLQASDVSDALRVDAPLCLFRIAQEALANAVRHASADCIKVILHRVGDGIQLTVSDNGVGFDPWGTREHASLGIASMRERVRLLHGELDIESTQGAGTSIIAWVPGKVSTS